MSQIILENINKSFFISKRQKGLRGALKGLFKREKMEVKALENLSFQVKQGEILGYLGPNGAGKSTTLKILSGILTPDSGNCLVNGRIPWKDRIGHVREIGVVFGQRTQLWWDLPVLESFDLLRAMYKVPEQRYRCNKEKLVDLLDLKELLHTPVRQLSLGQRMRCEIAASMLHDPKILFLDEPTIGLDAVSKLAIRSFIKELNSDFGVTVILTTHDMDDIEALCSRILVIGRGNILFSGSLESLRSRLGQERRMIIEMEHHTDLSSHDRVLEIKGDGNRFEIIYEPSNISPGDLVKEMVSIYPVKDIIMENPPIEEIIARLYSSPREVL